MAVRSEAEFVVPLRLKDEISAALRETAAEAIKSSRSFSSLQSTVVSLNQAYELAGSAIRHITGPMQEMLAEFEKADEATSRLANSMASVGKFSAAGLSGLVSFGAGLERTTTVSGDVVEGLLATAIAFGKSEAMAKKMVTTAANLAAVTKKDLGSAFDALLKASEGQAMSLKRLIPGLRDYTEAEAMAGKVLDDVARRFPGFAEAAAKTFAGAKIQAENAFNEIKEVIGQAISEAFDLPDSMRAKAKFFYEVADLLRRDLLPAVRLLREQFLALADAVAKVDFKALAESLLVLSAVIAGFKLAAFVAELVLAIKAIGGLSAAVAAMGGMAGILAQVSAFFSGAAFAAAAKAMVLAAAKFLLVAGAILLVAASVDILVKNFDHLEDVWDLLSKAFDNLLLRIQRGLKGISLMIANTMETIFSAIAGSFLDIGGQATKDLEGIRKSQERLVAEFDDIEQRLAGNQDSLAAAAAKVDFGFAGQAVTFIKELMSGLDQAQEKAQNLGLTAPENVAPGFDPAMDTGGFDVLGDIDKGFAHASDTLTNAFSDAAALLENGIQKPFQAFIRGLNGEFKSFDEAKKAFKDGDTWAGIGLATEAVFQNAGAIIAGGAVDALQQGMASFADAPDKLMKSLGELDKTIDKFLGAFPGMVQAALAKLPQVIEKLLAAAPKIVEAIANALPQLAGAMAQMIPQVIRELMNQLPMIMDAMADAVIMLIAALPEIVDALVDKLPAIIEKFFEIIPRLFLAILQMLPQLVENIMENIDEIVLAFVTGIIAAAGEMANAFIEFILNGGLERIIGALLRAIPRIVVALVQGFIRGISKAVGSIFGGSKMKMPKAITDLPNKIADGAKKLGENLVKETSQLFAVKDFQEGLGGKGAAAMDPMLAMEFMEEKVKGLIDRLIEAWRWIWNTLLKPFVDMLTALWKFVWEVILKPVINGLRAVWTWIYNGVILPLLNGLKAVWTAVLTVFNTVVMLLKGVWDAAMLAFNLVVTALGETWKTIKAGWDKVIKFLGGLGEKIWIGLKAKFDEAKEYLQGLGASIFDGLKAGINKAGSLFTGIGTKIWDGLKAGFDAIGNLFSKIFDTSAAWGKGKVEKALNIDIPFLKFAKGGYVPGQAKVPGDSGLNDRVLALMSPGEAVIPRSRMNDPAVARIVQAILDGSIKAGKHWGGSISVGGQKVSVGSDGVKVGGKGLDQIAGSAYNDLKGQLGGMDPSQMMPDLLGKVYDAFWKMLEGNSFADGGMVGATSSGGSGFTPGMSAASTSLPRMRQTYKGVSGSTGAGGQVLNIGTIVINPQTATSDADIKNKIVPAVRGALKRASQDGEFILSTKGVR